MACYDLGIFGLGSQSQPYMPKLIILTDFFSHWPDFNEHVARVQLEDAPLAGQVQLTGIMEILFTDDHHRLTSARDLEATNA